MSHLHWHGGEPGSIANVACSPGWTRSSPPSPPSSSTSLSSSTHLGWKRSWHRRHAAGHRMTAPPSPAASSPKPCSPSPPHRHPDRASADRSCTGDASAAGNAAPRFPARQPSRAPSTGFAEGPERVHEQLVRRHLQDHIVGHISRDATEMETREKPPAGRRMTRRLRRASASVGVRASMKSATRAADPHRAAAHAVARRDSQVAIPFARTANSASCGSTTSWIRHTTPGVSSMIASPRAAFR